MPRFLVVAGLAAALAVGLAPGAAAATVSSKYAITGIETSFPTNNTSTFGGSARGSSGDVAVWSASVQHQSLANCPFGTGTSCAITGGSFSLRSSSGANVTDTFTNKGTVTPVSQQPGCGKQVFAVAGALATSAGPGSFTATLTHYRTSLFGACVPYFATITGSVQFG
jgi:hypothetical protein